MHDLAIRRLRVFDKPQIETHFQNLDDEALRSRFGMIVPRKFVENYASGVLSNAALVYGAFPDSHLRGVAELRQVEDGPTYAAEAAFTVETPWQGHGIGDALLSRLIAGARNRGIREVHMLCLATNQRMRHLAKKHDADLNLVPGQVEATLTPPWPTPFSVAQELAGEYHAYARAVFSWPDER